jgi:hypothetical protein
LAAISSWARTLDGTRAALVRLVDGRDAVTQILQEGNTYMIARQLFESSWRPHVVAMELS